MLEYHIVADAMLDMFFLAHNLFVNKLTESHDQKQLASFTDFFDFQNILCAGMEILVDKISMFNQHHVWRASTTIVYPLATADSARNFANIEKYVTNAGNDLDLNFIRLVLSLNIDLN